MSKPFLNLLVAMLLLTTAIGPAFAGTSDSVTVHGIILPTSRPHADFSANITSGSAPLSVQFTDHSTGNPETWRWDFDNNGIVDSTARNPAHVYSAPGTYSVKLTVTNSLGSDTKVKQRYITVTMQDPTVRIRALKDYIQGLRIPQWAKWMLIAPLTNAEYFVRRGNDRAAVSMMRTFIQDVRMLRWFGILNGNQANYMIDEAQGIIDMINA